MATGAVRSPPFKDILALDMDRPEPNPVCRAWWNDGYRNAVNRFIQCGEQVRLRRRLSKYSLPYDKRVFDALADTKLSILHLHYLERPYLDQFKDFNAPVIHYSVTTSGIPISEVRKQYSQPIAGGVDEIDFGKLTVDEMRQEWTAAWKEAGSKYIAAPGCSVPDKTTPEALSRFPQSFGI